MRITILTCLFTLCFHWSHGQNLLKRLEEKAKEKTTDRVEQKTDEKIDDALDKVFGGRKKKTENGGDGPGEYQENEETVEDQSDKGSTVGLNILNRLNSNANCDVQSSYTYQNEYTMKVTMKEKKKDKEEVMMFKIYAQKDATNMAYVVTESTSSPESEGTTIILDPKDSSTVMLMNRDGQKMGMCSKSYHPTANEESGSWQNMDNSKWKKTGRTKTIAGKLCHEHIYEDDESKTTAWIADDRSMSQIMDGLKQSSFVAIYGASPWGFILEMTSEDKKSGDTTVMEVVDIKENQSHTINTSGYMFYSR